jgi:hypothetical protein
LFTISWISSDLQPLSCKTTLAFTKCKFIHQSIDTLVFSLQLVLANAPTAEAPVPRPQQLGLHFDDTSSSDQTSMVVTNFEII